MERLSVVLDPAAAAPLGCLPLTAFDLALSACPARLRVRAQVFATAKPVLILSS
jgi:hypothetical protein